MIIISADEYDEMVSEIDRHHKDFEKIRGQVHFALDTHVTEDYTLLERYSACLKAIRNIVG